MLCVEDHPVCMELVESMLQTRPDIRLLKATTGREGVALARAESPDVVLLDMHLPDIGGLEVVRALSELGPATWSSFTTDFTLGRAPTIFSTSPLAVSLGTSPVIRTIRL